jgi:hypothetical protein
LEDKTAETDEDTEMREIRNNIGIVSCGATLYTALCIWLMSDICLSLKYRGQRNIEDREI